MTTTDGNTLTTPGAAASPPQRAEAPTLAQLWRDPALATRAFPAFLVDEPRGWRTVEWADAAARIEALAAGFRMLDVERGSRVAILGRTRLEWTLADFALLAIGAAVVPIYPTSSDADVRHILVDSGARVVVHEDGVGEDALAEAQRQGVELVHVFPFSRQEELEASGRDALQARPDLVAEAADRVSPDDLATLVYTSGTTGAPKGCKLTHRNYATMVDTVAGLDLTRPGDVVLLHLPLPHTFARLIELLGARVGLTVAFVPGVERLATAIAGVRPHVLPTVPRVYEKVQARVEAKVAASLPPARALARWALRQGRSAALRREAGLPLPPALRLRHAVADRLVLAKVRAQLGGRVRIAISGGAPLSRKTALFFHALGVTVLEGYGLTEATTASHLNLPDAFRLGTVGRGLPGVEAELAPDGELLLRGPTVFAGYWNDERATADVLADEGWLRTGDLAERDSDGFVRIIGRKKDLLVTSGGKNVAPSRVEVALTRSPHVSDVLVVGDARPYLGALIALDPEAAAGRTDEERRLLAKAAIAGANATLGDWEHVRRFALLPRPLSVEAGELTPTLKVRRAVVTARYADEIESMFGR